MGRFLQASFFTKIGTAPRPPEPSINYSPHQKPPLETKSLHRDITVEALEVVNRKTALLELVV